MEIALSGIIILIILLPGISFRKGYFSGEFSKQYTVKDFFDLFINTLIPSLILYTFSYPIILWLGYFFDFKILFSLLSSEKDILNPAFNKIEEFKNEICLFQIILNICSFFIGLISKNITIKHSLDTKTDFLRYNNIWHYIISARFIRFERSQISLSTNTIEDIDITYVDALINIGDLSFIYTGILVDYELSSDGSLDLLYLKNAERKLIDSSNSNIYQQIGGSIIILKYTNIVNLNLSFINIDIDQNYDVKFNLIS